MHNIEEGVVWSGSEEPRHYHPRRKIKLVTS
jgi:hypothetical protein